MKQFFKIIAVAVLLLAISKTSAHAAGNTAGNSAVLISAHMKQEDYRVVKLRAYLEERKSPLAPYAEVFITEADKNKLDWKFLVSVSGVESGYGKHIPAGSYNGWGWGYHNGSVMRFASWDEAIRTISKDIREKYMYQRGAQDIHDIGRVYAANPMWAHRVITFMNKLETYETKSDSLPISI
jgi:hypothetical protein